MSDLTITPDGLAIVAEKPAIVLMPVGDVPADLLDHLVAPLGLTFGLPCAAEADWKRQ